MSKFLSKKITTGLNLKIHTEILDHILTLDIHPIDDLMI